MLTCSFLSMALLECTNVTPQSNGFFFVIARKVAFKVKMDKALNTPASVRILRASPCSPGTSPALGSASVGIRSRRCIGGGNSVPRGS